MALRDDLKPTGRRGVFFKEHPTRKYGVKKDRQFVLRYTIGGKTRVESLGWASDGQSEIAAEQKLAFFKANHKAGEGPTSLAEEEQIRQKEILAEQAKAKQAETEHKHRETTFADYWTENYFTHIQHSKKTQSWKTERSLYDHWIEPTIGKLKFHEIAPLHLRAIKKKMTEAGKSPATIRMAYFVVQQLWNLAVSDGYAEGVSPTKDKQAGMPKKKSLNNKRERYLTPEETERLFAGLKAKSERLHDIALLSLHTGMRASEVFSLTWDCIDFEKGTIRLLDTKTRSPRSVPITETASNMLKSRKGKNKKGLVFPAREGKQSVWVSKAFRDVVKEQKLNEGITDRRMRVCFHSLRHSCASFLVNNGVPIYTVAEILGHSSLDMTKRYAHLKEEHKKQSISAIEKALSKKQESQEETANG